MGNVNYEAVLEGLENNILHRHIDQLVERSVEWVGNKGGSLVDEFEGDMDIDVEVMNDVVGDVVEESGMGEGMLDGVVEEIVDVGPRYSGRVKKGTGDALEGKEFIPRRSARITRKPGWINNDF